MSDQSRARAALEALMDRLDRIRASGSMAQSIEWDDDAAQFLADHGRAALEAMAQQDNGRSPDRSSGCDANPAGCSTGAKVSVAAGEPPAQQADAPVAWPPRFTILPEGAAALFLRRYQEATPQDVSDLAEVINHFCAKVAAPPPQQVPEGWVLVPREPTEEMVKAVREFRKRGSYLSHPEVRDWRGQSNGDTFESWENDYSAALCRAALAAAPVRAKEEGEK